MWSPLPAATCFGETCGCEFQVQGVAGVSLFSVEGWPLTVFRPLFSLKRFRCWCPLVLVCAVGVLCLPCTPNWNGARRAWRGTWRRSEPSFRGFISSPTLSCCRFVGGVAVVRASAGGAPVAGRPDWPLTPFFLWVLNRSSPKAPTRRPSSPFTRSCSTQWIGLLTTARCPT